MADVILGTVDDRDPNPTNQGNKDPNKAPKEPAMMPNSGVRYDSVYGVAGTPPSSVFIVYRNEKTYPKYLVRYKEID